MITKRFCIAAFVLIIVVSETVVDGNICPNGWQFVDDVCLQHFNETAVTWSEAEELCRRKNKSHLVVINNQRKYDNIFEYTAGKGREFWIGARREKYHGYMWVDGTKLNHNHSFWSAGQPNMYSNWCAYLMKSVGKKAGLSDNSCTMEIRYICQLQDADHCEPPWYKVEGICIQFMRYQFSWSEAKADCTKIGSKLVVLKGSLWTPIISLANQLYGDEWSFWVGVHNDEGTFKWVDAGTSYAVNKSSWIPGEPDGNQHCVYVSDDGFSDEKCALRYDYICEKTAEYVRLVDGRTNAEGRIEVFHDNEWGTVCDDGFDARDASVVCTMLGLPSSGAHPTNAFGRGNGTIWLGFVGCVGNETSLTSCSLREWRVHYCGHSEDVGVMCVEATSVRVRLVDGSSPFDGIVELNIDKTWRTVCYSGFGLRTAWKVHRVVRRLGEEPAKLRDIRCTGSETSLEQCYHSGLFTNSCDTDSNYSKVLHVFCIPECLPPVRNCKIAGHTCDEENRAVCSECEDNFQLTADHQQCELKHYSFLESSEFPVFISGWACASLLLIVLIITCVVFRIRGSKTAGKSNLEKEKTDKSPSELGKKQRQNTTETPMTTCQRYENPFTTEQSALQQDDIYDVPEVMYEEPQNRRRCQETCVRIYRNIHQ